MATVVIVIVLALAVGFVFYNRFGRRVVMRCPRCGYEGQSRSVFDRVRRTWVQVCPRCGT